MSYLMIAAVWVSFSFGHRSISLDVSLDNCGRLGFFHCSVISLSFTTEISAGNALIDLQTSKRLCYLDSIDWGSIVRDGIAYVSTNNATCE